MISKLDKMLINKLDYLYQRSIEDYIVTKSQFLNLNEKSIAFSHLKNISKSDWCFFGGVDGAERGCIYFLPDYANISEFHQLAILEVESNEFAKRTLEHRDYLGAILGLGVKREKIGDIFVENKKGFIIIDDNLADFIKAELDFVANVAVNVRTVSFSDVNLTKSEGKSLRSTVASLRLDNIVGSILNQSRSKSIELIKSGRVFLNDIEIDKADKVASLGDNITIRGYGRASIMSIGSKNRKDRTPIEYLFWGKNIK